MLDGPDYPDASSSGKIRHDELLKENERLKTILLENGISWVPEKIKEPVKIHKMTTRKSAASAEEQLPHLPIEIQLRILKFVVQCPFPVIDPFTKPRLEHLTKEEQMQRKNYPLSECQVRHTQAPWSTRFLSSRLTRFGRNSRHLQSIP